MKISIITVNRDNKNGIEQTFDSVAKQTFQGFEYIVVDGASTDGSVDVIKDNARVNSWLSEPDSGVYDAMNKGINLANGDYLLFLNSGDFLYQDDVLEKVVRDLNGAEIIYGNLHFADSEESHVYHYPDRLTFSFMYEFSLGHPATFIRRDLFDRYGLYDTQYTIVADWAFFVWVICKENVSTKYISDVISTFDMSGMSSDPKNADQINQERTLFLQKNFSAFLEDYREYTELKDRVERLKTNKAFRLLKRLGIKKFKGF